MFLVMQIAEDIPKIVLILVDGFACPLFKISILRKWNYFESSSKTGKINFLIFSLILFVYLVLLGSPHC